MSINSISNNSQAYTVVDDVLRHKDKISHVRNDKIKKSLLELAKVFKEK